VIFAGIGVLLLAAKDVSDSQDVLADLFNRIEYFFRRLEIYTEVPPTSAMTDIIIQIMVEVLSIVAMATKELKRGRFSESMADLFTIAEEAGQINARRGADGSHRANSDYAQHRK